MPAARPPRSKEPAYLDITSRSALQITRQKSHVVVAKEGDKVKMIRFGQQGVKTNQTKGQRGV